MPQKRTINLIRSNTVQSPELESIQRSLQKTSSIALIVFLVVSLLCGSVYFLSTYQISQADEQRKQLLTQVNALKNREVYLLAIRERTKTVEKAMGSQKPWANMLDMITEFAAPPFLTAVRVDDQDRISINIKSSTLEDILTIVNAILANVESKKIRNPQILSFQVTKNGSFEISISFYALFSAI